MIRSSIPRHHHHAIAISSNPVEFARVVPWSTNPALEGTVAKRLDQALRTGDLSVKDALGQAGDWWDQERNSPLASHVTLPGMPWLWIVGVFIALESCDRVGQSVGGCCAAIVRILPAQPRNDRGGSWFHRGSLGSFSSWPCPSCCRWRCR